MNFKYSFIIAALFSICFSNLAVSQESTPEKQTAQQTEQNPEQTPGPSEQTPGPKAAPTTNEKPPAQAAPAKNRTERVSSAQYSLGITIIGIESETSGKAHRITTIKPDAPAARAGLLPNDIILSINNIRTGEMRTFRDLVQNSRGNKITLVVERDGKRFNFSVQPEQWGADIVERIIQLPKKPNSDPGKKDQNETNFRINNIADLGTIADPANEKGVNGFLKSLQQVVPKTAAAQDSGSGSKSGPPRPAIAADKSESKINPANLTSKKTDLDKRRAKPNEPLLVQSGTLLERVSIVYHSELGQLSIRGRPDDVKRVEDAIKSFMQLTSAPGQSQEVISLLNIEPTRAATAISEVYNQRFAARHGAATITPRVHPPALIVVGRPKAIETIRGLVAAFDSTK